MFSLLRLYIVEEAVFSCYQHSCLMQLHVCHDSGLLVLGATTEIPCVNDFRVACFSMFEPLLCSLTFLMCSAFLVFRDLPVSPKYRQIF